MVKAQGGYSPIWADRDVPPVRAGFLGKNSLQTGLSFPKSSVKAGICLKMPVKTGHFGHFGTKSSVKPGSFQIFRAAHPCHFWGRVTPREAVYLDVKSQIYVVSV